jgi:HSP20 family protein
MNRLFDELTGDTGSTAGGGAERTIAPPIDACESADQLEITAELPGVSPNDVDVRIEDKMLTIRGNKPDERQNKRAHIAERSFGTFTRSIHLPFAPDPDQVQARFDNGVLIISLPNEARLNRYRIEVRSSEGRVEQQTIEGHAMPIGEAMGGREQGQADDQASTGAFDTAAPAGTDQQRDWQQQSDRQQQAQRQLQSAPEVKLELEDDQTPMVDVKLEEDSRSNDEEKDA